MKRLTRENDQYSCRFLGGCPAEKWIEKHTGVTICDWNDEYICDDCPFEKYINRLAEFEDKEEKDVK